MHVLHPLKLLTIQRHGGNFCVWINFVQYSTECKRYKNFSFQCSNCYRLERGSDFQISTVHVQFKFNFSVSLLQLCLHLFFIAVEKDEVVMHHNEAYETVTRMNHSRPVTEVATEPCPAYGFVGSYHEWHCTFIYFFVVCVLA